MTRKAAETTAHRVGVFADPQVRVPPAPLDDEPQWSGATRRYSAVLGHVRSAMQEFRRSEVACVVQLGDLVDVGNAKTSPPCSAEALAVMEAELVACHAGGLDRVHHLIGNNDVHHFSRTDWASYEWARRARRAVGRDVPEEGAYTHYYDFKPFEDLRWRFVLLDSYAVNIIPNASNNEDEAKAMLSAPGAGSVGCTSLAADASTKEFRDSLFGEPYNRLGPGDPRRRFTWGNGGFGSEQLTWLRGVLKAVSERRGERAILFAHNPVHPKVVNDPDALAYDYDELLRVISEYKDCVVAYLAGHDHFGGYAFDADPGVHHLTVPSPLEAEPGTGSRFLILDLDDDRVLLKGSAAVPVEPIQRAWPATAGQLREGESEDPEGRARELQAQLTQRWLNFGTHRGVVWPAKLP